MIGSLGKAEERGLVVGYFVFVDWVHLFYCMDVFLLLDSSSDMDCEFSVRSPKSIFLRYLGT